MRKFIVVGCGGSGGATLRFLIDQLRADFRSRGYGTDLPPAWQFVHIDVPVDPDRGPAPLPDIRAMGGTYISLSSPTNTYKATALNVEAKLGQRQDGANLAPLLGWAPRDKDRANSIPVTNGAGQYRAVGRMLTMPRVDQIRQSLADAQAKAVAPGAWGSVPVGEQRSDVIVPIVVGSMAGGSGASMFLDVCRILGQLPGINTQNMGAFLYTADVFGQLPPDSRANVEGNAMAAIPEIFAAISKLSEPYDLDALRAMGLTVTATGEPPFGRVLPIGRRVGGSGGPFFGDGSQMGVYRGVARALAGVMGSEEASAQYLDYFIGNPHEKASSSERFGWGISNRDLPFGSLGFASLSLGRDRYLDYAAQRLSRAAVDHLVEGHKQPGSQLPDTDQIRLLLDNQWAHSLRALGLPLPGESIPQWFQTVALPSVQADAMVRDGSAPVSAVIGNTGSAQAASWLGVVGQAVGSVRDVVIHNLRDAAYRWAEGWALQLERNARAEFERVVATSGLPYARELMARVRQHCDQLVGPMSDAGMTADGTDPVAFEPTLAQQAQALGKQAVGAEHALGQALKQGLLRASGKRLRLEALKLAAPVLRSWAADVLGALEEQANVAMATIDHARAQTVGGAGLAQLDSTLYGEWPDESDRVPPRFNQALNEVLLTTADQFPDQFKADASAHGGGRTYGEGLARLRHEVLSGVWETAGTRSEHHVLQQKVHWRPSCLPRSADGTPTRESKPTYQLEMAPEQVVMRARDLLSSHGGVFARFAGESIRNYLMGLDLSTVERSRRQEEFVARFVETLAMARPVVGVDSAMAQRLHPEMNDVQYTYSFSEMPFEAKEPSRMSAGDPVTEALLDRFTGMNDVSPESRTNLNRSMKGDTGTAAQAGKISILGTYAKVSPLCYSSLLEPIKQAWNGAIPAARRSLWEWKRTRPLTAAVAMSRDELLLVSTGWYLGRLLGLVRQGQDLANPEASVCTPTGWVPFGPFLDSRDTTVRTAFDLFPTVLMSHAWALVRCSGDPDLTPLAPYEALRHLVDVTPSNGGKPLITSLAGVRLLNAAFYGRPLLVDGRSYRGDALSRMLTGEVAAPAAPAAAPGYGGYPAQPYGGYPSQPYGAPAQPYGAPGGYPGVTGYPGLSGYPWGSGAPAPATVSPVALTPEEAHRRHHLTVEWIGRQMARIEGEGMIRNGAAHVGAVEALQAASLYQECHPIVVQAFGFLRQLADVAISLPADEAPDPTYPGRFGDDPEI